MTSAKKIVVFDMDGVLVNSQKAVRAAYYLAGLDFKEEDWGKAWTDWMPGWLKDDPSKAYELHEQKNHYLRQLIENTDLVQELPPANLLRHLIKSGRRTKILTGASEEAAIMTLKKINLLDAPILGFNCNRAEKGYRLNGLVLAGFKVLYIDDNPSVVLPTQCRDVTVFYYTGDGFLLSQAIEDFYFAQ